jgi:tetratricopeptide (TPR) repeat protein
MKKIIILTIACSLPLLSYATDTFNIPAAAPLTIKLLDSAWSNRENTDNQKIIADYLATSPVVPQDYETAWKTARMVYFIGNYGIGEKAYVSTSAGAKLFDYGVSAAKVAIAIDPSKIEGQYWFAVDLGSYGLAKGVMAAAGGSGPGMDALRKAIAIDPTYQYYGSSRILGRYYQELPGLMGGSNKKALTLLTTATDKAPQFRNNWLFLGKYYLSVSDYQKALDSCNKAIELPALDGKYEEMRYLREANECASTAKSKLSS